MNAVDEYLNKLSHAEKIALEHIRHIVKTELPEAEEVISYGMPGFKYKGKYLLGYAAFKDHLSFFPTSEPVELLNSKLSEFKLSKGAIQFFTERPIPDDVIIKALKIRINAINK